MFPILYWIWVSFFIWGGADWIVEVCWTRIILGAYINPLGVTFWRCIKKKRFPPLRVVRERIFVTLVFSSLFWIKISPLLPVDAGTLPNHVKSGISLVVCWFSLNCLLMVDLLCFRFRCWVFNSMIGDRSQHLLHTHILVSLKMYIHILQSYMYILHILTHACI